MQNFQLGSFVLNGQLILYACFWLAGSLLLQVWLRGKPERGQILSWTSNAFLLWLLVWKASFLLFHPLEAIRQPLSLLYFDGGEFGGWLASFAAAVYIWRKAAKLAWPASRWFELVILFALAGWTARRLVLFLSGEQPAWLHATSAGVTAALLLLYLFASRVGANKSWIVVLALIGFVAHDIYDDVRTPGADMNAAAKAGESGLETGIRKGQLAPDFALTDLQGNRVQLSDFRGRKVLLNFWASWCPPCRAEMPHMQRFYEDHAAKDVVILGVNLTPTEKHPDHVHTFVREQQLTFPIVLDREGEVESMYQVIAYPTTFVLDSDGVIREKYLGPIHYEMMKDAVSGIR